MKKVRIVCLANSSKLQGRCLAGILLDDNNIPVKPNMWFRPISNKGHGEIDTALVNNINLLDIIEIEVSDFIDKNNYQSENVYFTDNSIKKIGVLDKKYLDKMIETDSLTFGNRGKAISKDCICFLQKSLMFIKIESYEVTKNKKIKISFEYKGTFYKEITITDPSFICNYKQGNFSNIKPIYLSLSVAMKYNDWYTKLVAGVIY
ncbi:hypothetical protein [Capnocytophaga leadbetteri]|jgi:hypothetical protein|uniref:dual OB domain-containing protein n=1 Tax=Capnocytophaga leadbetteri TaxID=327575 RepID=UPI0026EB3068|nr:hypothetical protein [Capnocytophaga leadbetteri]